MIQALFYITFFLFSLHAYDTQWETENEDEALFLRRIADFWQEGEYQIVKSQIEEFLQLYPKSAFYQTLSATLGDLYVREKNFKEALIHYSKLTDSKIKDRSFFNRMQCLLELQWFATLADECELYLSQWGFDPDQKKRGTYLLAIALYQQCLNTPEESEEFTVLAKRALPHFQFLLDSDLAAEVTPAFAHLCCMCKDFSTASKIYIRLAEGNQNQEEMLFQAALLETKSDRRKAIQLFTQVEQLAGNRAADALYNRLVLMVDLQSYEEVIANKEAFVKALSPERRMSVRLLFGHCHLKLKQFSEAIQELSSLLEFCSEPSEPHRLAFVDLLDALYNVGDEDALEKMLTRFSEIFPNDSQVAKGILAHALLLKSQNRIEETRERLRHLVFTIGNWFPRAFFELISLEFQQQRWEECCALCRSYLERFSESEWFPSVARFLVAASSHGAREQLISDLESLIKLKGFEEKELQDWRIVLAKSYYLSKNYQNTREILERFFLKNPACVRLADAHLLRGLCFRDEEHDLVRFCEEATIALNLGAELLEPGAIHIAIFNACVALKDFRRAAEHLYSASKSQALQPDHLLWLADYYYEESSLIKSNELCTRTVELLEKCVVCSGVSLQTFNESQLSYEIVFVRLAELAGVVGKEERQKEILEMLKQLRAEHPTWSWQQEDRVDFLLAECYLKSGQEEEALMLFETISEKNRSNRSFVAASASLQSARLQVAKWMKTPSSPPIKILTQLKTLVLQKTFANEPVHLEAAFEYVDLQTVLEKDSVEKRLSLLRKTQKDFQEEGDLLSSDYQKSRKNFPEQDRIYSLYMDLLDAEILLCKASLSGNYEEQATMRKRAVSTLEKLLKKPMTGFLKKRAERLLESIAKEPEQTQLSWGNEFRSSLLGLVSVDEE